MKQLYKALLGALSMAFLVGCGGATPTSNEAISTKITHENETLDLLDVSAEEMLEENENDQELYFADTQGKVFYSGMSNAKTDVGYRVELLLNDLFFSAKAKLPRVNRRKKLYISVVVGQKSYKRTNILEAAQEYILSHRHYGLANTDRQSMNVLKKVLRQERDGIYKHTAKGTKLRSSSDVVLYVSASKSKEYLYLKAKLISKNGEILAQTKSKINLNQSKVQQTWVEVRVPRNDAPAQLFEVMSKAVSQNEFYGKGGDDPVVNISFSQANNYCKSKLNAELLHPYVFEYARRSLVLKRPSSSVSSEIIAPFDEEDHEVYYQEGDYLEVEDGDIVLFDWNSEKYFAVSNLYRSPETTFRCMRSK
ncbi:MAG: hypothetical protein GXO11_03220 [Epsilonproteobacteria bacterium]|nr:hypothetical protein [Campylobacterota bacterium]